MIVSMWMTRELVTIGPEASVTEAAALMAERGIRRLPVVESLDKGARLLGLISAREVLHAFPPDVNPFAVVTATEHSPGMPVSRIMRRDVPAASPEMPIEEAAAMMREQKIGELPVLRDGRLVGLMTESDIFRAFVDLFTVPGRGARITFDMSRGEDVFALMGPLAQKHNVRVVTLISAHEHEQPVCVVRVAGDQVDRLLEDLWASGHRVLNVLRFLPGGS